MKKINSHPKITNRRGLADMGACDDGLIHFEEVFGKSDVKINRKNAMKTEPSFIHWFAFKTMDEQKYTRYSKLWAKAVDRHQTRHLHFDYTTSELAKLRAYIEFKKEIVNGFFKLRNEKN